MTKRLSARLSRLEQASATGSLSVAAADLLASCFGRLHATFMPSRSHPHSWAAVRQLRQGYLSGTVGISARSPGQRDWVSGHDARRELVAAGLALAVRGDVETTGLVLTALGRATAWHMVLPVVPSMPLAEDYVTALAEMPADRVRAEERWVSESSLFAMDCVGDSAQWDHYTDAMLDPSITGSVDCLCDVSGRAYYRYIRPFEPLPTVERIESSDRAIDAYVAAFKSELPRLKKLESSDGEIVVPLSVTV